MSNAAKLVIDGLLVAGFGVQHSTLATLRAKARAKRRFGIEPIAWRSVESLSNVVYILVAASLWQGTSLTVWHVTGAAADIMWVGLALSWLWYWQLHLFEYDCGLAFGSTSLVSALAKRPASRLVPWKIGSRRWIRFPVHTAFFGMFFLLPHMSAELFVLAVVLNIYNVIGSVLYDKRLDKLAGETYRPYVAVTGLIWPPLYRAPGGAGSMTMAAPQHWRRPAMHWPGIVGGIALASLYYFTLGHSHPAPADMLKAGGVGLLGALIVGAAIGRVSRPAAPDWDQRQTDLSTTVALAAALGVSLWAGAIWLRTGAPPAFAAYLPLWFIVQYLGHVFAYLAHRKVFDATEEQPQPVVSKVPADAKTPVLAGANR